MGNVQTALQMSNYSNRNVRVFLTKESLEMNNFISSERGGYDKISSPLPQDEKFSFRKNMECVRVLASQTREVPWESQHFVSLFVEDDDDEKICSRDIVLNMALSAPVTVLLYDV
ncbi:unnamed protein product [Pleuronectes platessa]|uniref:Uncharacterized protein n=1 Tax=Pleuronectes platessa TaxID=8262 RepID=A0A9N7YZM7_PLEPL|nr:unnamed protein product [Pleuronectes platessa]